jgi:hypothetical protein
VSERNATSTYNHIKCSTCGVPSEAYHQVEAALLRAVEVLGNIRAPVPVPLSLIDEILAQARAALRLEVAPSAGGARQTPQPEEGAPIRRPEGAECMKESQSIRGLARLVAELRAATEKCRGMIDDYQNMSEYLRQLALCHTLEARVDAAVAEVLRKEEHE